MEQIKLSTLEQKLHQIIEAISRSNQPVLITDGEKSLVKIVPISTQTQSWLGSMKGTGKIIDNIVDPAAEPEIWDVLAE
ncbi:MAG: hypothetical protein AAF614_17175 [Chloroflexota bacterium]